MSDIDVKDLVPISFRIILRRGRTRWVPEVAEGRFKDTGTGTYNVNGAELLFGSYKHAFKVRPRCYVCLLENCSRLAFTELTHKSLGFISEAEVRKKDIGTAFKEKTSKF